VLRRSTALGLGIALLAASTVSAGRPPATYLIDCAGGTLTATWNGVKVSKVSYYWIDAGTGFPGGGGDFIPGVENPKKPFGSASRSIDPALVDVFVDFFGGPLTNTTFLHEEPGHCTA
jgi:hypothetical protein